MGRLLFKCILGGNHDREAWGMKISVIVPNHGRDLGILLESLKTSSHRVDDVIVIDRGLERSKQRNMGILEAHGIAYLFLDSDHSISPDLVKECVELIKAGYSCIYIPEVIIVKSFFGRIRAFERTFYTGTAVDVPRFVKADHCPFFDESMSGPEDADWGNRIKGFRAISKNVLYHHDDISLLEYCKKKAYYSKSMNRYKKKWPNDPCLDFKYRCWTVFTEKGKWKRLLRHPILTLGIIFIILIRGVIYVRNA